ncbi:MAG TPA: ornithine carbamoyltransferase [Holophagaceae bacterium]|nr:ornithine carbamoyltransferase [Holophagaceae bacterium]
MIKNRHFLSLNDYSASEIKELLDTAAEIKKHPKRFRKALKGQVLAMIFEKSSTRTRVSFEAGMYQLGGAAQFLSSRDIQLGRGEPISDTAAVLSRYVQGIMARTFAHQTVTDLAKYGSVPVINGLTDLEHPCQIMADLQTIREHFGTLKGLKMTYIGDGNNMAHSYMQGAGKVGMDCTIITPKDPKYYPNAEIIKGAETDHAVQGTKLVLTDDVMGGVAGSHIVITDTWISMGMEEEKAERMAAFKGFGVTNEIMEAAGKDAIFLHCLPAYRGYEVDAEVIDGPRSLIYDEAENRLHAQKAIMYHLMKKD